eukprot:PRCOL_00002504-RA
MLTTGGARGGEGAGSEAQERYEVVNFYCLVDVDDPHALVERHQRFVREEGLDLRGRIYFSEQGVNAQLSGRSDHASRYAEFARESHEGMRAAGFDVKCWQVGAHAFPRLSLRYKRNLVGVPGGCQSLPLSDSDARCDLLSPKEWRETIENEILNGDGGEGDSKTVLIDLRNAYEHDVGHFKGALRPESDQFNEQHLAMPEGVDPEKDKVLMYCTGGIRCDVYSTKMREMGYKNLYSLEGGIANYFKDEGDIGSPAWDGHLFVFDARLAVPPVAPETVPPPEMQQEALETALEAIEGKDMREIERNGPPPERGEGRHRRRTKRLERQRQRREAYLLSLGEHGESMAAEAAERLAARAAVAGADDGTSGDSAETTLEQKQLERIKRRAIEAAYRNRRKRQS